MVNFSAIGTLGKDSEVRDAGTTKVINFSIAVNVGYGDKKSTMWIECAKFGDKTAVSDYLKKGTKVYVSGEPSLRQWESNGKHGASINLRVQEVELLGKKDDQQQTETTAPSAPTVDATIDDVPF